MNPVDPEPETPNASGTVVAKTPNGKAIGRRSPGPLTGRGARIPWEIRKERNDRLG